MATYVTETFVHNPSVLNACFIETDYSHLYFLALINSSLLSEYFYRTSPKSGKGLFPKVLVEDIRRFPIRRVSFTTLRERREALVGQGRQLYEVDPSSVVAFVEERLSAQPEESDVVHDLLAFLAEEMIRLNKEKQSRIKVFLSWLEKEILKGSVEDQKNKTKIKDFYNNTFEDLLDVLKKNKIIPDPCPSNIRDIIASEFSAAVNALTPLKTRIKVTDDLIDQIVYRLYSLTDDEISIVEGSITTTTRTK